MSASLRMRITLYVLALALTAGTFVVIGVMASSKRAFWIARLQSWEGQSTDFAAECKAAVRDLHFKLLRYELSRAAADKAEFLQAEAALSEWIEARHREIVVPEMHQILGEIRRAFFGYSSNAHQLLSLNALSASDRSAQQMLERIEKDATLIMVIDTKLRAAQHASLEALVTRARRDVDWIWRIFYACMAALFFCGAVVARIVYRNMIAPLRLSVARSRRLLERQEKLGALGTLAAGMAHEIRNPLNSIRARLFTQRKLIGPDSPGREDNEFIDGEIDRLEAIVEESLRFARPAPPSVQRQLPLSMLDGLCQLVRPFLEKAEIELRTDFQDSRELCFDADQVKQALLNLIINAADSIGRRGVITLRTRLANPKGLRPTPTAFAIEVEDNGPGIARSVQPRLFDPFFTTKENGTGLGLSITARIVHAHGGWIECESELGRGALFRILLPLEIPA